MFVRIPAIATLYVILAVASGGAFAGFAGTNTKGDYGLQSGTQPPPGLLITPMYYRYSGDTLRDSKGDKISIDPQERGSLDANAYVLGFIWVSNDIKILGGNYSFQAFPAFTDNTLEVPVLGLDDSVDTGFADLYFQPINLGWHTDRADFIAGLGITAPIGEYEPGGSNNTGLGMWSFEPFIGSTVYLDEAKSWSFAATAFYAFNSEKKDTDIQVGDILTIEGGLGKTFMDGSLSVGAAYYAQWKMTEDDLGRGNAFPGSRDLGKHEVYGLGPEVTIPIALKGKLYGFINARYLWEFGARSTLEGNTFVLTAILPFP
ncbi:MAG: transporter [Chromatiales bacterium]|jgi:hypothetical protein